MEFRSERQQSKEYIINYIPTLSKQHSYTLLAFYPCATQSNGEIGFQSDLYYKFDRGTIFGGKYGTKINIPEIDLIIDKFKNQKLAPKR